MLICLAISCGLIGLLFLYIRQKLYVFEMRINTISDIVRELTQELAGPRQFNLQERVTIKAESESDSDSESESEEDESDNETDCESQSDDSEHSEVEIEVEVEDINEITVVKSESDVIELDLGTPLENIVLDDETDKIEVSDDEDIKMVVIEKSLYDGLSVKELKAKVAELGGPSNLKTKKALLEFLEKK